MTQRAERHLASGRFASMSELVRAGLRALDREEAALDMLLRARVAEALADERPAVPVTEAFTEYARQLPGRRRDPYRPGVAAGDAGPHRPPRMDRGIG
jgi:antitoxin ParD1/3/4